MSRLTEKATRLRRRSFDPRTGLAKRPANVLSAVKRGCVTMYLRCERCRHTTERDISDFDPLGYIPDAGIGMSCERCGHTEIETWPKYPSVV